MEKSAEESPASATTPEVNVYVRPVQPKKKKKRKKSDKREAEMVSISQQAIVNICEGWRVILLPNNFRQSLWGLVLDNLSAIVVIKTFPH